MNSNFVEELNVLLYKQFQQEKFLLEESNSLNKEKQKYSQGNLK